MSGTSDNKRCLLCGELLDDNHCQFCNEDYEEDENDEDTLYELEQKEYYKNVIAPQLKTLNRR